VVVEECQQEEEEEEEEDEQEEEGSISPARTGRKAKVRPQGDQ